MRASAMGQAGWRRDGRYIVDQCLAVAWLGRYRAHEAIELHMIAVIAGFYDLEVL